jgi:hypothetical protein
MEPQPITKQYPGHNTIIAEASALLARGDMDAIALALPGLESLIPSDEAQWKQLRNIFAQLGRSAWVEIITRRFLDVEPTNLNAQLDRILQLSSTPNRKEEAFLTLTPLLGMPYETAEQFFTLGTICMKCSKPGPASYWFQKARHADRGSVDLRFRLFWSFVFLPDLEQARMELVAIRSLSNDNQTQLIILSEAALQTGDVSLAVEAFEATVALARSEGWAGPGLVLRQAIRLDRTPDVAELAASVDMASFGVAGLESTFKLLEGRGMLDLERRIIAAALELEPGNVTFQSRARAHAGTPVGLFASSAAARGQGTRQSSRSASRLRQVLKFWR